MRSLPAVPICTLLAPAPPPAKNGRTVAVALLAGTCSRRIEVTTWTPVWFLYFSRSSGNTRRAPVVISGRFGPRMKMICTISVSPSPRSTQAKSFMYKTVWKKEKKLAFLILIDPMKLIWLSGFWKSLLSKV